MQNELLIVSGSPSLGGILMRSKELQSLRGMGSSHSLCVNLDKPLNLSGPQFFHL